ncbi:MAG: pyridoxamine 5'-phosphate oxidase family protein [Eubacteriales bacterium]
MFREIDRLNKQIMKQEDVIEILETGTNGVLAVHGDNDYPYAVPLSYAYLNGKIYFHSTTATSHKIDAISKNPKVSFCVVAQDDIVPDKFNTLYKSVIAFGVARVLTNADEITEGIMAIAEKYSREHMEKGKALAQKHQGRFCVVEINIEHVTGKFGV